MMPYAGVEIGDDRPEPTEAYEGDSLDRVKVRQREARPERAPIERELERCDDAASRLGELVERLAHRLSPILGPERPEPARGEVRDAADTSALAGRLESLADRLMMVGDLVGRTERRIEL